MSMINQALKKAQRERLFNDTQTKPYLQHLPEFRPSRVRFLVGGGFVTFLVVGVALYGWLMVPNQQATMAKQPVVARQSPTGAPPQPSVSAVIAQSSPAITVPDIVPDTPPLTLAPQHQPSSSTEDPPSEAQNITSQAAIFHQPPRSTVMPARKKPSFILPSSTPAPLSSKRARAQAQLLFNQATTRQEDGQQAQAITLLHQAVTLNPALKEAYNRLGKLYYQQQQYRQALTMFQKALDIDPDYVKVRNNLGSTYLRLAMDEQAREELHKAIKADSTYGLAYYNLACVYARTGDSATAAQYLQHAMSIDPQARNWAQTDADFARVRGAPELRQLLGPS